MSETLAERLGLRLPKEYKLKSVPDGQGVDPTLLYGVELEIEGLEADEDTRARRAVAGMQYHKDGSLRNNGGEFVTLPMNFGVLSKVLENFFKAGKYTEENYSERCSVHVHANCVDLVPEQIRLIVCLYQILEKVLFNFVKADRDNNIFCVPLGESVVASQIIASDDVMLKKASRAWKKYTALNLLPLYTQGTLEFRHMGGTCDLNFILKWCEIIGSLFKYAREHKFDDVSKSMMDLNTSSAYAGFMQGIFRGDLYDELAVGPFREYLEEGVINMKVMLSAPPKEEVKSEYKFAIDPGGVVGLQRAGQWIVDDAALAQVPEIQGFGLQNLPREAAVHRVLTPREVERVRLYNLDRGRAGLLPLGRQEQYRWLDRNPDPEEAMNALRVPRPVRNR